MYLTSLATAVPPYRFTQSECWEAIRQAPQFPALDSRAHVLLKRLLSDRSCVATRHLALPNLADYFILTPDVLHRRFEEHAPKLATQAARLALENARITARQVDAVIVSTCTGYLCPGLTSYVIENLGLRQEVLALDLVGQGCGAALPNFATAKALLDAGQAKHVLSICVEVCSAAFYLDDDPGVLVSNCLFGDGAAAAILSARPEAHTRCLEWTAIASRHSPAHRDQLRFEHHGGMLRNRLSREVPQLAAEEARALLFDLLHGAGLRDSDLTAWILHAGGRQVIGALRHTLCLSEADLRFSSGVLRDFGNLSSPFVLFVLQKALAESAPGGWWWISSFGAGFSCHGGLLKVE